MPEREEVVRASEDGRVVVALQVQKLSLGTLNASKLHIIDPCCGWTQTP